MDKENTALMATLKMLADGVASLHDKFDVVLEETSKQGVTIEHIDKRVSAIEESTILKFNSFLSFLFKHPVISVVTMVIFGYFVMLAANLTTDRVEAKQQKTAKQLERPSE